MNYETPNGNTPPDTNLPFPENNLPAATCNNDPNIETRTTGFLQVVPPEPSQAMPDPETLAALIALGLKPGEPTESDPIIAQSPSSVLRLSEVPEQADSTEDGLVNDDHRVDLAAPPQPSPPPCEILETIDLGVLPWSKQPIREITPLVWFRYEREDVTIPERDSFVLYNVIDGNGRNLFCVNEEGMAHFFCCAANVYVQASLSTQV